jgi:diaminohydroxyphosphoribosylaminopyrimidine deaminase/5-amino-6-(5-phosphoribosylamino)uracil reductase
MKRPRVILKAGITLDGRIADVSGHSQWITGPEARAAGHRLRAQCDAILVGSGTLLADDPSLTTRVEGGQNARPVLLDSQLRCPDDARVLTAGLRPWIFCAPDAARRSLDAEIVRVARSAAGLDIRTVLAELWARGIRSVLVEGGGQVHRSLFDADVVDELHLFMAPRILADGAGWVGGRGISLAQAPQMRVQSASVLGGDLHLVFCRHGVTKSVPGGPPQK